MTSKDFRVLTTVHNIMNIPTELASGPTHHFAVVASATPSSMALQRQKDKTAAPDIVSVFNTTTGILMDDRLDAKLDQSLEWRFGSDLSRSGSGNLTDSPAIDVTITVYEMDASLASSQNYLNGNGHCNIGDKGGRLVAVGGPVRVDLRQLIEVDKINTLLIGTNMGQVGISFEVSPNDVEGYSLRLEAILSQINPNGIQNIPEVVRNHGEIETFTKLYKKYNVVNYAQRIEEYIAIYGKELLHRVPSWLEEWENREEELIRNLVLDNGPELKNVDFRRRLCAFKEKYNISDSQLDVEHVINSGEPHHLIMKNLTDRFGPEPDPRTYAFPSTFYTTPTPTSPMNEPLVRSRFTSPTGCAPDQMPSMMPSMMPNMNQSSNVGPGNRGSVIMNAAPTGPSNTMIDLWGKLCDDLRNSSVPLAELHYLNEVGLDALLVELGYPPHIRAQLSAEWTRRVRSALKQEQLSVGDAGYEAAKRDILSISGLHALNVNVVGVLALKNAEHEASFSLRLADAKVRATERLLMVGDFTKLLNHAIYGVSPCSGGTQASATFFRNTLSVFQKATSISVLICDVVIGKPSVIADLTSTPYEGTDEFLQEFDSCIFTDPVQGPAVAVYSNQQVLPRYIVHCNVDNSISPCPAHPSRPVEYLVVENNAFACSQCVVMGQYRGREVIPVEEASTQARTQLTEMYRDVDMLAKELSSVEEACTKHMGNLSAGEVRNNALRLADQIRRETEQRIQSLMLDAEEYERDQKHFTTQRKNRVHSVLAEVQALATMLQEKATKSATGAIDALLVLRNNSPIPPIKEKAVTVLTQVRAENADNTVDPITAKYAAQYQNIRYGVQKQPEPPVSYQENTSINTNFATTAKQTQQAQQPSFQFNTLGSPRVLNQNTSKNIIQTNEPAPKYTSDRYSPSMGDTVHTRISIDRSTSSQARQNVSDENRSNKESLTKGWNEHRKGNRSAAVHLWEGVYQRNPHNAFGARAKAYIAEAIEKDYDAAANWYEKALGYDPKDKMSLYNYGVLLETAMNRKREAYDLYEAGAKLGDKAAARKAADLKKKMGY